ncbi:hypothetical protein DFH09DRAFT_173366 [Mycena vulgaris]|nr:hypothetical protein DFH09DRAFT_173366 [Mycena vulgaris]
MQHAMSRLSKLRDDKFPARFFVTGQPGISKFSSLSAWVSRSCIASDRQELRLLLFPFPSARFGTEHISTPGPKEWPDTVQAIQKSWVLIDIDDKAEWSCPEIFRHARNLVPSSGSWSKEIAAVTERFAIERGTILERLKTGGPVARSLFSGWVPELSPETLRDEIKSASSANIFAFKPIDASVFLIQPLVMIDKSSGRARLQRTDYSAEFISAHIAHETLDLAQDQLEEVQGQLAAALNISTTRSVAGKVVEDLMHRALSRGMMKLPDVFGTGGAVVTTLELIGKAGSFVCETTTDIAKQRPLYLQPQSLNFPAVNPILVSDDELGLIQTSLGDSHSKDFATFLRIVSRLARGAKVRGHPSGDLIYCLVGTVPKRVEKLVADARRTLDQLRPLDAQKLSNQLSIRRNQIAHRRIATLPALGVALKSGSLPNPSSEQISL